MLKLYIDESKLKIADKGSIDALKTFTKNFLLEYIGKIQNNRSQRQKSRYLRIYFNIVQRFLRIKKLQTLT